MRASDAIIIRRPGLRHSRAEYEGVYCKSLLAEHDGLKTADQDAIEAHRAPLSGGGMVSGGALFPTLVIEGHVGQGLHFSDFLYGAIVAQGPDYAKLLIWAFIAGFAERLMPDLIDSFVSKAKGG